MFRTQVDKTNMHKADAGWTERCFVGIETRSTQFLMSNRCGVFSTSYHNIRRVTERGPSRTGALRTFNLQWRTTSPGARVQVSRELLLLVRLEAEKEVRDWTRVKNCMCQEAFASQIWIARSMATPGTPRDAAG